MFVWIILQISRFEQLYLVELYGVVSVSDSTTGRVYSSLHFCQVSLIDECLYLPSSPPENINQWLTQHQTNVDQKMLPSMPHIKKCRL